AVAVLERLALRGTTCGALGVAPRPAQASPQGWSHTPIPGKCCPPHTGWDGARCKRDVKPPQEECTAKSVGNYPDCHSKSGYSGTPPNCRRIDVQDCTGGMVRVAGQCQCPQG